MRIISIVCVHASKINHKNVFSSIIVVSLQPNLPPHPPVTINDQYKFHIEIATIRSNVEVQKECTVCLVQVTGNESELLD